MKSSKRHGCRQAHAAALFHACFGIFASTATQAQPAPSQAQAQHSVVMLLPGLSDQGPCAAELEAVQNQLADLAVSVELAPLGPTLTQTDEILEAASQIAAARSALLVFWTPSSRGDFPSGSTGCTTASRVYLFTADSEGGQFLVRDLGSSQSDSEAAREALGIIVRSTLRALLLGERIQGTKVQTVPGTPPSTAAAGGSTVRLDIVAQYGVWGLSNQIPVNHGARLGLGLSGAMLSAGLGWRLNARGQATVSDVSVVRHSGGPEVFASLCLGKRVRFATEAAFFVERVELEVTSAPAGAEVESHEARWVPGAGASLGISVEAGARWHLFALLGADVPLERTRYMAKKSGSEQLIQEGWWVRPTFRAGALFSIFSSDFRPKGRVDAP